MGQKDGSYRLNSHDPGLTPSEDFPNLTPPTHRIIGPETRAYNCIAWACGDTANWWEPGPDFYWPFPAGLEDCGVGDLVMATTTLGYVECEDGTLEAGFEKIALYAHSQFEYTHAARQLPSGIWTSKLRRGELIEHDTPEAIAGGAYGTIFQFMKRPTPPS